MKATLENIKKVTTLLNEWHSDNFGGGDFGQFDDESDLLHSVKSIIEQLEEEDKNIIKKK